MSGGVDSATAAARAVEAGHEVTGVHLALSRQPEVLPDRGPRLLHAGGRAGRAPGRRRHRHPVLRLGHGRTVPPRRGRGLRRRVRGRPHPQPVPALQREDQVRRGARPGAGPRLRRRGHRPLRPDHRRHAAPRRRPGQGPVLRAGRADRAAAQPRHVPARRHAQDRGPRGGGPAAGLAVADKPDSHDVCFIADGDTSGFLARHLGAAPGQITDTDGHRPRRARRDLRLHRRPAQGACAWATPPPTASPATSWTSSRSPGPSPSGPRRAWTSPGSPRSARSGPAGPPPAEPRDCLVQLRAHGEIHPCTAWLEGERAAHPSAPSGRAV